MKHATRIKFGGDAPEWYVGEKRHWWWLMSVPFNFANDNERVWVVR